MLHLEPWTSHDLARHLAHHSQPLATLMERPIVAPIVGWRVFLCSLVLLVLLRAPKVADKPRAHLNLRIFILGLCVGGIALYFTGYLAMAVVMAIVIWAPKPIMMWLNTRAAQREPAFTPRRRNPLKPAAGMVCQPAQPDAKHA